MNRLFNEPVLIGAAIRSCLLAAIALQWVRLTDQQIATVMVAAEAVLALFTRALVTPNQLAEQRVLEGGSPTKPRD